MENKEYLSEEEYQKNNQKVKKVGKIIMIVGAVLLVIGVITVIVAAIATGSQVSNGFNDPGSIKPTSLFGGFGISLVGIPLIGLGFFGIIVGLFVRFLIGNRREISAYMTQQEMPVAKEGIEKISPSAGVAAKEISKGVVEGIEEAKKEKKD